MELYKRIRNEGSMISLDINNNFNFYTYYTAVKEITKIIKLSI